MFHFLNKWFGRNKQTVKTRFSEKEVLAIARKAASEYPNCENLSMVSLEERLNHLIWVVSSATRGRTLEVFVDDATGEVIEIKQVGLR